MDKITLGGYSKTRPHGNSVWHYPVWSRTPVKDQKGIVCVKKDGGYYPIEGDKSSYAWLRLETNAPIIEEWIEDYEEEK